MRGEQAAVHGGDDGEEGDLLLVARAAPVGGQVRAGEAGPDGVGVEGEHELDGGAGEERGEERVDGAVDVVKREDVEQMILGRVFPRFNKRAALCCQSGLWQQDSFLFALLACELIQCV